MGFSFSKVECHNTCPYQFKLRYIDKLEVKPDMTPNNALYLGTAIHTGLETRDVEKAVADYLSNFDEHGEDHSIEVMKLRTILPEALKQIPEGEYERKLVDKDGFIGFIDCLVPVDENTYDMLDYKYSNNTSKYGNSAQLHVYKYYFEKITGKTIRNMYYVLVPKVMDILNENMTKEKLTAKITTAPTEVKYIKVDYDPTQVKFFFARKSQMENDTTYDKRKNRFCKWCEYYNYCQSDGKDLSELTDDAIKKICKPADGTLVETQLF